MRRHRIALSAILMMVLALGTTGCQTMQETSGAVHVANARSVYIAAVTTMTTLAQADLIDLNIAEQFESTRVRAAAMLEQADLAVESGADFQFSDLESTVQSLQDLLFIALGAIREGD